VPHVAGVEGQSRTAGVGRSAGDRIAHLDLGDRRPGRPVLHASRTQRAVTWFIFEFERAGGPASGERSGLPEPVDELQPTATPMDAYGRL
jgi:hypothetical protein